MWRHYQQTKLSLCTPELQSCVVFVVETRFDSGLKAEFDSFVVDVVVVVGGGGGGGGGHGGGGVLVSIF